MESLHELLSHENLVMKQHQIDVASGERFRFGKNWSNFLRHLTERRIRLAEESLLDMLDLRDLKGHFFLDIGSGSGLFSLAARNLGARVRSLDYDPDSVACTAELKKRYCPNDSTWTAEQASVLDDAYMSSLGVFDIVYSWGVLHHTGEMWHAIENAARATAPNGFLFIAIYNDQGSWSRHWLRIKRIYNRLPSVIRVPYAVMVMGLVQVKKFLGSLIRLRPMHYVREWTNYSEISLRGMSKWHDLIDWVGGYPFEVAKPEEIFEFLKARGFILIKLKTCAGSLGCNEYVFRRALK